MKSEGDSGVPGSLQHRVLQPPLVSTVVPLGEVRGAVGAFGRRPHLVAVHTATTLDPGTESAQDECEAPPLLEHTGGLKVQTSNVD